MILELPVIEQHPKHGIVCPDHHETRRKIKAGIGGDVWRKERERDRTNDSKCEPGPIDLNRYGVAMYGGIPTFMNFPVCLTQED